MDTKIVELMEKSRGGDDQNAFFALLEIPGDIAPALVEAFRSESHLLTRA
jgi:hypothetical protein